MNRRDWLEKLPKQEPEKSSAGEDQTRKASMASVFLDLTRIDPDTEYQMCGKVAQHLLGFVPEPPDPETD